MRVIKRDGSLQQFNINKIKRAVLAAASDTGTVPSDIMNVVTQVEKAALAHESDVSIATIESLIELKLNAAGYEGIAQAYVDYRNARSAIRATRLEPDPRACADFVAAGKYGMYRDDLERYESWADTTDRNEAMMLYRFPQYATDIKAAYACVRDGRLLPSMRSMQFGGKGILQHNTRIFNCAFTLINRLRVFQEIFYCLLCGTGVGFSVQYQHVAQLPEVKRVNTDLVHHFSIDDSIEGWADSVGELIRSYFLTGEYVEFDYSLIRDKGKRLSTSGGKAPGHLPLKTLHEQIRIQLDACAFRKLRPIEVFDLVCKIAEAVLAGGIRRSSLIAIFSPEDGEMVHAKVPGNYEWGGKNYWRRMANISAGCLKDNPPPPDFFKRLIRLAEAYGEPGVVWLAHPDCGCNPCAEIGMYPKLTTPDEKVTFLPAGTDMASTFDLKLEQHHGVICGDEQFEVDRSMSYDRFLLLTGKESDARAIARYGHDTGFQFCNLVDVNVAACKTEEEFLQACAYASIIGTMQATFTNMPYLGPVTEKITEREALIGVGLTGMCDKPLIAFNPDTLRRGAQVVVHTNTQWAQNLGINLSARCTTVKPSGTSSLVLGGVGSGIHPHHARRYFRRITETPLSPVAQAFKATNPHMVEVKPDGNWSITFCMQAPDGAVTVKELPAIEFMDMIFNVYDNWVRPGTRDIQVIPGLTHNVSCTVVVSKNEWDQVIQYAYDNRKRVASMSFLPRMGDKGIPFMPREEVVTTADEARWQHLIENYVPVDYSKIAETTNRTSEAACSGGVCEI